MCNLPGFPQGALQTPELQLLMFNRQVKVKPVETFQPTCSLSSTVTDQKQRQSLNPPRNRSVGHRERLDKNVSLVIEGQGSG